jgi:hypothetical protein
MSLKQFHDFRQVKNSTSEHYTKVKYFPKPILFITIYLLLNLKLNHNN